MKHQKTTPPAEHWQEQVADMFSGACSDQRAMMNLGAAQWRDMSRAMFGSWGQDNGSGESKYLSATTSATRLTRTARLFSPQGDLQGAPLVVMLHGCMQDSQSFAKLTRMDSIAREQGFHVLYPDQESSANPMQCWNWSSPENHERIGGEPEALAGLVEQAQKMCAAPARLTRMAGISAGGALAASMAHLYPELIGSVVVVAGPAPFSASNLREALDDMANGPGSGVEKALMGHALRTGARLGSQSPRRLPMLIVQGAADKTVNPLNADMQARGALMLNNALGDAGVDRPGGQRLEKSTGKSGVVKVWTDEEGQVVAVVVAPKDLGHAWSGGDMSEPFSQEGFDQSRLAVEFFQASEARDWSNFDARSLAERLWDKRRGAEMSRARGRPAKF